LAKRWISLVALGVVILAGRDAGAHKLPNFPQVRLVGVEAGREDLLLHRLTVEVRDPTGRDPLRGAKVSVRALHATLGSGLRVEAVQLTPVEEPGIYRGAIRFPQAGPWELTVEVIGRSVGDAHFRLEILAPLASEAEWRACKPDLPFDLPTLRHLAMEWGHLAGFALWLMATGVGLLEPTRHRRVVLVATWVAFATEGITGLYKMEYSTPFAAPLRLFNLERLPRVFFAEDYASTLIVKHVLIITAMAVTLALSLHAWRTKPGQGVALWRGLLGVNALLALAIGGAAAVLGFYHAIVLHFS